MDRLKAFFAPRKLDAGEYEPLTDDVPAFVDDGESVQADDIEDEAPFSWLEYCIFAVLGVAMLWAWNMFLAAAPYFQKRFESDGWISENFQSAIISASTVTNLVAMLVLTNLQSSASYPFRINVALATNVAVFALLTLSTAYYIDAAPSAYLAFVLVMVVCSAWATGLMQNGAFAFAAAFGRPEYTQAIMAGQGVGGILPPLAQMLSVLLVPDAPTHAPAAPPPHPDPGHPPPPPPPPVPPHTASTAAFIYFLTAVIVSAAALVAFAPLVQRHSRLVRQHLRRPDGNDNSNSSNSVADAERAARRFVGLPALLYRLRWFAGSVFGCFAVTMFFPVFTAKILSTHDHGPSSSPSLPRLLAPGAFIPLAFFVWNLGDLTGRVSAALPWRINAAVRARPPLLLAVALARLLFLPLYALCNLRGAGAVVPSDAFYLLVVQLPFGLTNGWLGASTMVAAAERAGEAEREAVGGFMSLCLVAGLTAGSLLSFGAGGL